MAKSRREGDEDQAELSRLKSENAKLRELLSSFSEIIYLAIQDGSGSLSTRIKVCVNSNTAKQKFYKEGWRVYQLNLTEETIKKVYPEKP